MFKNAMNWRIAPDQFWSMTLAEYYALVDLHAPKNKDGSKLTTVADLQADLAMSDADWWGVDKGTQGAADKALAAQLMGPSHG